MASEMQKPFEKKTCQNCKIGFYTIEGDCGDWWAKCNECGAFLFCYNPMDHQAQFHADRHK